MTPSHDANSDSVGRGSMFFPAVWALPARASRPAGEGLCAARGKEASSETGHEVGAQEHNSLLGALLADSPLHLSGQRCPGRSSCKGVWEVGASTGLPKRPWVLAKGRRGQLCCVCLIFYDGDDDPYNDYHFYQSGHSLPVASAPSSSDPRPPDTHAHTDPQEGTPEPPPQPLKTQVAEASCQAGDHKSHGPQHASRRGSQPRPPLARPQQGQLF